MKRNQVHHIHLTSNEHVHWDAVRWHGSTTATIFLYRMLDVEQDVQVGLLKLTRKAETENKENTACKEERQKRPTDVLKIKAIDSPVASSST